MAELQPQNGEAFRGAEEILEKQTIEYIKKLLKDNNINVKTKQTELQLMVGSRYHEMIESADGIVEMRLDAEKVVELLAELSAPYSLILEKSPLAGPTEEVNMTHSLGLPHKGGVTHLDTQSPAQVLLAAPSAIWVALDSHRYLEASDIFLLCEKAALAGLSDAHAETGVTDSQTPAQRSTAEMYWLRGQWSYVEQIAGRIISGAEGVLSQRGMSSEVYTESLLAISKVQKSSPGEILMLFLHYRSKWVLQALRRSNKYAGIQDLALSRRWLTESVKNLKQTALDVCRIFFNEGPLAKGGVESEMTNKLTLWISQAISSIVKSARKILREIKQARELTAFQAALHTTCQWSVIAKDASDSGSPAEPGASNQGGCPPDICKKMEEGLLLLRLQKDEEMATWMSRFSKEELRTLTKSLHLWGLMFSHIFAESAEFLLKHSLSKVQENFLARINSLMAVASQNNTARPSPGGAFAAAMASVSSFEKELRGTIADARASAKLNSPEEASAAGHFAFAIYARAVELLCCVARQLRHESEQAIARKEPHSLLLMLKVLGILSSRLPALEILLLPSKQGVGQDLPNSISLDQLQAAFEIADTDGDGIMTYDEALEALEAVAIGDQRTVVLDKSLYPNLNFSEFALFNTIVLDKQDPFKHFGACLELMVEKGSQKWTDLVTAVPVALLSKSFAGAAGEWKSYNEVSWRKVYGLWEQKPLQIETTSGDNSEEMVWFPTTLSDGLSRFLYSIANEIYSMISVADITQQVMSQFTTADKNSACWRVNPLTYAHSKMQNIVFQTLAETYSNVLKAGLSKTKTNTELCESCLLQLLFDTSFIQRLVKLENSFPSNLVEAFEQTVNSIKEAFDPINLQMYLPHIETNSKLCFQHSSVFYQIIFNKSCNVFEAPRSDEGTLHDQGVGNNHSSTNIVPLSQGVQRFALLPLMPQTTKETLFSKLARPSNAADGGFRVSSNSDSLGSKARSLMGQIGQNRGYKLVVGLGASASNFLSSSTAGKS